MTPYQYVNNNPVNFIDPTGMSAYPPPEGSFTNGDVHNDSDGSWTFHDGGWYDNSLGQDNFLQGVEIPFGQIGSDNMGDTIPCVECHHKTTFDGGTKNDPYGVMLYGNESTGFKAPLGSKTIDVTNIQGFLDLSDEFSPEVSKRLENASELFKHIEFSQKSKSNENSKVIYPLVKFNITSMYSDYVKVFPFHTKDTVIDKKKFLK